MITYLITGSDGVERRFDVDLDRGRPESAGAAEWTSLARHRCPHCPLSLDESSVCPPAADLAEVVACFTDDSSIDRVDVRVITDAREVTWSGDLQAALRSLVGLLMASSTCPVLAELKAPARHHLPFATSAETLYRVAGAYLLRQYFIARDGGEPDMALEGLRAIYDDLALLNVHFARRLRSAVNQDAGVNALASLFSLGHLVSFSLEDELAELRQLFVNGPSQASGAKEP